MEKTILVCDCCGAEPAVRQRYTTPYMVESRDLCLEHMSAALGRALAMLNPEQVTECIIGLSSGPPRVLFCCGCAIEVGIEVQTCPTHGQERRHG